MMAAELAGRLLGASAISPEVVGLIGDLLTPETGHVIAVRTVEPDEIGLSPRLLPDIVLGVVRHGRFARAHAPAVQSLVDGDRVFYVRRRD